MQIFILMQRSDSCLSHPQQARGMVIVARDEDAARRMAQQNEDEERDDGLLWDAERASCDVLTATGCERVILVA